MPTTKTIKLHEPVPGVGGVMITTVTFRAPTFLDVMDLGEPEVLIGLGEGKAFFQEDAAAIRAYIERLSDLDPNFLPRLGLKDTLECKRAVKFFFRDAMMEKPPNEEAFGTASPAPSSSDTASPFTPSTL